jgi:ribosome-associated protein
MRLDVSQGLAIDDREIEETFIHASGPGGQNTNKVATAVQLRFDARHSPSLPDTVRARLQVLAGGKMTRDGVLVITAQRFRSQQRNREDALERLLQLLREAAVRAPVRRPTRASFAERQRRLEAKGRRASLKRLRSERLDE